jgi:drug/metabolite transporter (DMT)-like permease
MSDPTPASLRSRLYLAYAIVALVWGSTYLAIRVGVRELPPFGMAGLRFLTAGIVLALWARLTGTRFPRGAAAWGWGVLTGVLVLGVAVGGMVWAEVHIESGMADLLAGMSPIFMAFYGSLGTQGDRLSAGLWAGLFIGFAGLAILVGPVGGTSGGVPLAPVLVILVGTQAWCGGSVLATRKLKGVPPLATSAIHHLAAGIFLLAGDLLLRGFSWPRVSPAAWLSLAYLVLFGSVIAYSAYFFLITHLPPARAGTYSYINPVVAVFLGWLVLTETVTLRVVVGGLVILTGLFLVRRARLSRRPSVPVTPVAMR